MSLPEFSVRRPVTVFMATVAVTIFGFLCAQMLPVELLPDLSYPSLTIQTTYPDAAPRSVELCFQTAGLWEIAAKQTLALPASVERVTVHRDPQRADAGLLAVVTPRDAGQAFDALVVDETGTVYVTLTGYQTTPLSSINTSWQPAPERVDAPAIAASPSA